MQAMEEGMLCGGWTGVLKRGRCIFIMISRAVMKSASPVKDRPVRAHGLYKVTSVNTWSSSGLMEEIPGRSVTFEKCSPVGMSLQAGRITASLCLSTFAV